MALVTVAASSAWPVPGILRATSPGLKSWYVTPAAKGAQIILIQALFQTPSFCIDQSPEHFDLAQTLEDSPLIEHFSALAERAGCGAAVVVFERAGNAHYNSLVMIDADGEVLDVYRKTHIPKWPGLSRKNNSSLRVIPALWCGKPNTPMLVLASAGSMVPGNSTQLGVVGRGCNLLPDNWFRTGLSRNRLAATWTRVPQGHAAAKNIIPVIASNRVGTEKSKFVEGLEMTFYGSSFIANQTACFKRNGG